MNQYFIPAQQSNLNFVWSCMDNFSMHIRIHNIAYSFRKGGGGLMYHDGHIHMILGKKWIAISTILACNTETNLNIMPGFYLQGGGWGEASPPKQPASPPLPPPQKKRKGRENERERERGRGGDQGIWVI
jgi:hypothetical protein